MASKLLRFFTLSAGLLAGTAFGADYPTQVQSIPNLVGYWRFQPDTLAGSSINGYTGSFIGDAAIGASASGPSLRGIADNPALLLDGNGDGVLTNLAAQVTFPTAATVVAWVYLGTQPSAAGRILYIAGRSQSGNDMDFQIDPDNRARFYTTAGGGVAAPAALPLQQWVMVAASFDTAANTRSMYIDGQLVGTDTPGVHSANSAAFTVGYSTVWGNRWFPGAIDEVAIYNRALTDDEISSLEEAAGDLIFRSGVEY